MSGIKRCEATLEKVRKFYEDNGYMPEFYNPYNNVEITDITPTSTANCDRITNSATVLVFENELKERDKLTNIKREVPKQKPFTYVSLFSGIGGFEQALNKLGGTCVFASEIDKFAAQAYETLYGEKPAGDITKVDARDIPDHDLLVGGFPCFAAGTLITTSEGLKPIEKVRKGDKVLTHTNTFKDVVVPMVKRKKGIYELKVMGSPITYVTEEHPIYVREMSRVWDSENKTNIRKWSNPKWVEAKDLEPRKHFVGMSENNESKNPYNISHEDAWLIGRYVADGYIRNGKRSGRENSHNNQVIYCVGKDKIDEFTQKITSYNVGVSEERTVYKCRIINKRFMDLCKMAGRGSENKRVPSFILDLPNDILESFLDGYLSGDGNVRDGNYQATSVSKELIYGLGQVVQKLYNTPYSIQYFERPKTTVIEGRTVNQRDTWTIRFRKENRKQQDGVYIDGMLWMPVRSLEYIEEFDDLVYNFEVEGDNSYVANNLTVHNCQAFSVAGKREGFADTRGTLFFDIARIAAEKKPKALLLENVKGLINHDKGNTLDTMIRTLNDIGYIVDFDVLNSKYFGVPQNRERIFIVAIREDLIEAEPFRDEATAGNTIVPKGKRRIGEWASVFNFDWSEQTEVTTRLRDILETDVDEKYYLDDEKTAKLVAQLEERPNDENIPLEGFGRLAGLRNRDDRVFAYQGDKKRSTAQENIYLRDKATADSVTVGHMPKYIEVLPTEPCMLGHIDIKGNDSIKRTYSTEGISPTLTTMGGGHRQTKIAEKQTPVQYNRKDGIGKELEQANTISASDWRGLNRNQNQNAILEEVRPVLTPEREEKRQNGRIFKEDGEESFTLTSQDRHGVAIGEKPKYRIRKLTPRECWRLQGFPDEAHDAVESAGISDSQRYKQAGNAVTVNVIEAIAERLIPLIS